MHCFVLLLRWFCCCYIPALRAHPIFIYVVYMSHIFRLSPSFSSLLRQYSLNVYSLLCSLGHQMSLTFPFPSCLRHSDLGQYVAMLYYSWSILSRKLTVMTERLRPAQDEPVDPLKRRKSSMFAGGDCKLLLGIAFLFLFFSKCKLIYPFSPVCAICSCESITHLMICMLSLLHHILFAWCGGCVDRRRVCASVEGMYYGVGRIMGISSVGNPLDDVTQHLMPETT